MTFLPSNSEPAYAIPPDLMTVGTSASTPFLGKVIMPGSLSL
jgi:hypothetical protein